jgi:dTDP-4-amino-4,6-dideoxygalactose transaminase
MPILVPELPPTEEVLAFLRRIDNSHVYSNYGPLWHEFRDGLAAYVGGHSRQNDVCVSLVSSGTIAVEVALRARAMPKTRYCLLPSYTFIATAHAVANAHLEPFFADVDERSLAITPEIAADALRRMPERPGAVVVVSPFGSPPDIAMWEEFETEFGVPVIFDAAAAVTTIGRIGHQPLCVSLHATKVLGIGEGGAILTTDRALKDETTAMTNFGFYGLARLSEVRGGNYRISEYACAVGLAMLARIERRIETLKRVTNLYLKSLAHIDVRTQDGCGTDWLTMTFNVILPQSCLERTLARFDREEIPWRRWWGLGCHRHPAFANCPGTDLPVTTSLAPRVIGVPFFDSITHEQIESVCAALEGSS